MHEVDLDPLPRREAEPAPAEPLCHISDRPHLRGAELPPDGVEPQGDQPILLLPDGTRDLGLQPASVSVKSFPVHPVGGGGPSSLITRWTRDIPSGGHSEVVGLYRDDLAGVFRSRIPREELGVQGKKMRPPLECVHQRDRLVGFTQDVEGRRERLGRGEP